MKGALLLLGLAGCTQDTGLTHQPIETIAVVTGDFDDVREPLKRMSVRHDLFDGIISTATWDADYNPDRALTWEGLIASEENLAAYDAVWVASGVRGLGLRVYNGVESDSGVLQDAMAMDRVRAYAERGNGLWVSDWAYDLMEAAWPDWVDFAGDDALPDRAQCGVSQRISARVTDPRLVDRLQSDVVSLSFPFSNWAVVQEVSPDLTVWMRGEVRCRLSGSTEETLFEDVPLLISREFPQGSVVFSSFPMDAQRDGLVDETVLELMGPMRSSGGER